MDDSIFIDLFANTNGREEMALIRQFSKNGISYPAAYSRITSIRCDKSDAYILVCTYENESARFNNDFPVHSEEIITSLPNLTGEVFPKAYEFVKTCEGFEDATDHPVIEA